MKHEHEQCMYELYLYQVIQNTDEVMRTQEMM